ncbi:MAG: acyltransferase family protein, partial [Myxococcales bacterium]|nr:acyltransferase family protein [Myxococcales bacterium]
MSDPNARERRIERRREPIAAHLRPAPSGGEVDALRRALDDLRDEIRQRFGAARREAISRQDAPRRSGWEVLLEALQRRIGRLGMTERSGEVDEFGMDEIALRRARPILDFLFEHYWRVDLAGLEQLPEQGPCLIVANRSGLLPYDGLLLSHAIEQRHPSGVRPRFFVADWLMTAPFAQPTLARLGGVRACRENAARLLAAGHFVIVFPEGAKGAAKVFRERYHLQRFGRGGAIRVALETGAPLVPVGIVGAEEVHPVLFKWHAPARALGLPFLPVTPTFPLLGPLGVVPLPSKWVIRIGRPISFAGVASGAATDELLLSRLNEELRGKIQA